VRWRTALGTGEAGEVTLTPTRVLAPSGKDLAVLDRVSGRITARWGDGRGLSARPWYANGSLYLLGHSGMVWALDAP
jgi:hypothetical protein